MQSLKILFLTISTFLKKMFGLFNMPKRYSQLLDEVRRTKSSHIMEIGTWQGTRARAMIEEAKKMRNAKDIHYYGFDLFETMDVNQFAYEISKQPPTLTDIEKKLQETGVNVHLYKGNTMKTLPAVISDLPPMDVIFIDGGHSLETIQNDWRCAKALMSEKTAVIFDDYWLNRHDGARPVVDAIDRTKYTVNLLPVVDVFFNPNFGRLVIVFAKVTRCS